GRQAIGAGTDVVTYGWRDTGCARGGDSTGSPSIGSSVAATTASYRDTGRVAEPTPRLRRSPSEAPNAEGDLSRGGCVALSVSFRNLETPLDGGALEERSECPCHVREILYANQRSG